MTNHLMRDPVRQRQSAEVRVGRVGIFPYGTLLECAQEAIYNARLVSEGAPLVPWYTPVVGSGPLGLPRELIAAAPNLAEAIGVRLTEANYGQQIVDLTESDPLEWVSDFVARLIDDRAGSEIGMVQGTPTVPVATLASQLHDEAVWVTVIAAATTRLFHRMSLDVARPIGPWGSDLADLPTRHDRWQATKDEYIDGLQNLLTWASGELEGTPAGTRFPQLFKLLGHIRDNAGRGRVAVHELQQVTQVAWLLLVESVAERPYPGWTELMLQLLLEDAEGVEKGHRRHRLRDLEKDAQTIRRMLHESTSASWRGLSPSLDNIENKEFYDSVARVLWSQHEFAQRNDPVPTGGLAAVTNAVTSPYPTAFATSFDFELEMALWRTAPPAGGRFSIILPTYLLQGPGDREGSFLWLLGTIEVPAISERAARTEDDYTEILAPSAWAVVRTGQELPKHPIVVRLAGCPLVDISEAPRSGDVLADLQRLGLADGAPARSGRLRLIHSITVDEYLAVRQTEAEWLWSALVSAKEDGLGLPKSLTLTKGDEPVRYWMLMGVPIKDSAIRMRVLAVLARDDSEPSGGGDTEQPDAAVPALPSTVATSATPSSLLRIGLGPRPDRPGDAPGAAARTRVARREPSRVRRVGVTINTRCDDDEVMLLHSLGLEVVRDRCEHYTDDLKEYAEWLSDQNLPGHE